MLQTIQIIAIIQGLFLLIVLYKNKKSYLFTNYFYLNAALISLLIYLIGDDNTNLFISNSDLFLVDNTFFITFLLLFVKNFNSQKPIQFFKIIPYFIPVAVYFCLEIYELFFVETYYIEVVEHFLYFTFVIYLSLAFYYTQKLSVSTVIKVPFFILIISLFIDYSADIFTFVTRIPNIANFNSILIFSIAIVFYYLTYLFVFNSDFINLPINKYKNSSLNDDDIQTFVSRMKEVMEQQKLYLNQDLSLQSFSEKTTISKHYISEILNTHLNKTFTQFVNEYRVQEFIKLYTNNQNNQYSILGIANSVGFKNKATFNTAFKKIKGESPSKYRKNSIE